MSEEAERILVLEPGRAERHYWRDLWLYRELFVILAWRDLSVRYKQTVIGVAWAVLRPLLMVAIFTFIFGRVANLPSEGTAPYVLMVAVGALAWTLFSTVLSEASASLVQNANLIGKVYFPRLIVPTATVVVALVDAGITLLLLFGLMAVLGFVPDWRMVFLPAFMALTVLAALGPALMLAAMNVKFRDFRYVIPFVIQFGAYVSPVGYTSNVVPSEYRLLYSLNPVVGAIDGMRWSLLRGEATLYLPGFLASLAVVAFFLVLGITYFRATEKSFADLI
jgi:lipopolysaccharide transport system permease protein